MLHQAMAHVYVGVDIHRRSHTATIINCFFEKLGEVTFGNRLPDFPMLEDEVKKHTGDGVTPVYGLEDCTSLGRELAIYLMGRGHTVKYVNPSLSKSERNSQASLHKTDSFDSLCIARVLLSKLGQLPDARTDDRLWALTELVMKRRYLVKASVGLKNQLHNYVSHHYPSYGQFFSAFDCKTALAFWEKYPSLKVLSGADPLELSKFLSEKSSGYFSFGKACEIFAIATEDGYVENEMQDVCDFMVTFSAGQLRDVRVQIGTLDEKIKELLPLFGYKLESMKGISHTTAAALIVEIGDIDRFKNAAHLASYAGISPAEYSSGNSERNISNKRGNRNLNQLLFFLAVSQINDHGPKGGPWSGIFAAYYEKKISEGKTKKQAIKCVQRRLINIIYRLMKDRCEYRPPVLPCAKTEPAKDD